MINATEFPFKHFVDEINLVVKDLPRFFSIFAEFLVNQTKTVGQYGIEKYMIEHGPREETSSVFEAKGSLSFSNNFRRYRLEIVQEGDKVRLYFWSKQQITMALYATNLMRRALHRAYTQYASEI
ncbi:MAG TPA: hypothetical protein VKM55_04330 [Candidatus Lokiarchaeia archaeon]|nr:hypothetical protein [Candidatus Lokiarchaeia archaeon]